jgi:hypothetical protein
VRELEYADGWKVVSYTTVDARGLIQCKAEIEGSMTLATGQLERQLERELRADLAQGKVPVREDGVPTYIVHIDNWRARIPQSVAKLRTVKDQVIDHARAQVKTVPQGKENSSGR